MLLLGTAVVVTGLTAETLYNGIVLPATWPPHRTLTNRTSLAAPWYTAAAGHPAAVIVDVGRQLLIDDFLIGGSSNATIVFHAPTLAEAAPGTYVGGAGLWWDSAAGHFKNFFTCTKSFRIHGDGALGPVCLQTSTDGVHWRNHTTPTGTNVVWDRPAFSRALLLDELAPAAQRWKLAQVEFSNASYTGKEFKLVYQLYASPDGLSWKRQSATPGIDGGVGSPGDCSSAMINPFRNVTVLSAKTTDSSLGRYRNYAEANAFSEESFSGDCFVPWAAADVDDPKWLGSVDSGGIEHYAAVPELYNLDG